MVICLIIYEAENMKLVSAALTNILSSGRLSKLVMRDFPGVLFLSPPKPATHAHVCACTHTHARVSPPRRKPSTWIITQIGGRSGGSISLCDCNSGQEPVPPRKGMTLILHETGLSTSPSIHLSLRSEEFGPNTFRAQ